MMENVLAAVEVRKRFGALVVLDGVDFAVAPGEAVGIVGPNGAGKTTLLNVLSGSLRPNAGRVELRGNDVTSLGAAQRCRLGVGRAHQVPRPFGNLTVFENVFVGASTGSRVIVIRDPEATEFFETVPEKVRLMMNQAITNFTGEKSAAASWLKLVSTQDVVGLKVCSAPGPSRSSWSRRSRSCARAGSPSSGSSTSSTCSCR